MIDDTLRIVFAPWGVDNAGDDLWLFENGLVFAVESLIEALPPQGNAQCADLYAQLSGDTVRSAAVRPASEQQLSRIADRAPAGTAAIVDGMLTVVRDETAALRSVEVAPRVLRLSDRQFETPDAFIFDAFDPAHTDTRVLNVTDPDRFFALAFAVAESILAPLGVEIPAYLGPEFLHITDDFAAYQLFLKAKRLVRTTEEKVGYYRQTLARDPDFFLARFNIGQLMKQQDDYAAARREFLTATRAAGDDPGLLSDTYFELGLCSIHMGDTKSARHFWDQALTYSPDNPSLLVNVAGTYEQEENWQKAIELHERALAVLPDYHKALVSLARLKTMVGNVSDAIPLYERALELQPHDALREAILGGCYLAIEDEEEARIHLQRASQLDPARPKSRNPEEEQASPGDYARAELAKL
ncbi:MAG TPA: tetratricopeptide repeat protein [Capsulimonadaceae bacterium]|jgi:tetratricopeptide (TPR) repeat protein